MQYRRDKKGNELSVLGYGCMRFTKNGSSVDLDKAEKEVMAAIKAGVNYFDTAYVYAGNEAAVGEILDRNHCREQIYLATKLPHYLIKSVAGAEKMFQEELRRLKTDYIDYYLMHMLTDIPTWEKLKKIGMQDWIEEKLASGQIRNIGFSYHGNTEMFKQLVDACDWDFCQIQYNYINLTHQAGTEGLKYAASNFRVVALSIPCLLPAEKHGEKQKCPRSAFFRVFDLDFSEQNILRLELIFFGNGADHLAGHPRSDDAGGNVMSDDASRPDNRACPDGNAAADGGICADPDVFLQRNGCRGANAVAALLRIDGMTGAGKAYAGGNKGTCSDVYRRGIQNDTVIIDDRQAVGMDIEAIVTVEIWLNAGHGRAGAQQGLQDTAPLFLFVGSGAVVLPTQLLCTVLFLRGGVFIATDIGGRVFHNIQSVHHVCPFHTVFF